MNLKYVALSYEHYDNSDVGVLPCIIMASVHSEYFISICHVLISSTVVSVAVSP